jgi:hypothetical protein
LGTTTRRSTASRFSGGIGRWRRHWGWSHGFGWADWIGVEVRLLYRACRASIQRRHPKLSSLHRKAEPAFDKGDRVLAEHPVAPAVQDRQAFARPCGERFHFLGPRNQSGCNAGFLGADLQKQLQEVGEQRGVG